jgi:hypothetical protein
LANSERIDTTDEERKLAFIEDPAKQQLKKARETRKRMNESGARIVQSLREAARRLRSQTAPDHSHRR